MYLSSVLLQISAEEIKDNRVVNFEVQARKLDNKVWVILFKLLNAAIHFLENFLLIQVHFTWWSVSLLYSFFQDFFGKSDPYLEFYKQTETDWQLAHRTEVTRSANHSAATDRSTAVERARQLN